MFTTAGLICSALLAADCFAEVREGAEKAQKLAGRSRLLAGLLVCAVVLLLA